MALLIGIGLVYTICQKLMGTSFHVPIRPDAPDFCPLSVSENMGMGGTCHQEVRRPCTLIIQQSAIQTIDEKHYIFFLFFTSLIQANYRLYFLRNHQNNLFKQFRIFKFTPPLCSKFAVQLMHANFNLFTFKNFISNCRLSNSK